MNLLLLMMVTVGSSVSMSVDYHPLSDEFIDYINSVQSDWKAGRNFHKDTKLENLKHLTGLLRKPERRTLEKKVYSLEEIGDIPTEFDSRKQWPNCPSISEIRDQGNCGSCWANAGVGVITDRHCIHTKVPFHFSTEDVVSCDQDSDGCNGGFMSSPFDFYVSEGIVSGGAYNSSQGCCPYEIPPCDHFTNGTLPMCSGHYLPTPKCKNTCEPSYNKTYIKDKHFGKSSYGLLADEKQIQKEIMTNGPVAVGFTVYADFLSYKSGVYRHTKGKVVGAHAVRMIGWGVEKDTPYWLIANSWNSEWGDHGYIKIVRGKDDCGIIDEAVAGMPKV